MVSRPVFKSDLQVHVISGEGAIVLSEKGIETFRGSLYELIVPLIDGLRSTDELVDILADRVEPAKVYYALILLEKNGYLAEWTQERDNEEGASGDDGLPATSLEKLVITACRVAAARAIENTRPDRLFHDPWAEALAGDIDTTWFADHDEDCQPPVLRTRFFDDFIMDVTTVRHVRQVVILGAGMDTRAFRLSWPTGTHVFELDQPSLFAVKEQVLVEAGAVAQCRRRTIEVDLTAAWEEALFDAGFDPRRPSAWLLEGLLVYLPEHAALDLLNRVAALATEGSWLGLDLQNPDTLTSPLIRSSIRNLAASGTPYRFCPHEPEQLLRACGWAVVASRELDEIGLDYGRSFRRVLPRSMSGIPRAFLITAQRRPAS